MSRFKVVLVEPKIPSNTGNIGRTCVTTNSELHLVGPLGFEISHSRLKRAGLDYWSALTWKIHSHFEEWESQQVFSCQTWFFSTKGQKSLYDIPFQPQDALVFGSETTGLNQNILTKYPAHTVRIPILNSVRSLNLANAVAVALYEALRSTKAFSSSDFIKKELIPRV